jgi:ADP-L-glycero-D-manno-heptose 6-epimerase
MDSIAKQCALTNPEIRVVGLRYFNVYGPREFYKGKTASMVLQLGHQILSNMQPRLFDGSDNIFRDFIYIDDVIQAIIKSCELKENGLYNVGTGIPRSFQDISEILQNELNTNLGTEYFPNPFSGYQYHTQADINSTKSELNFLPQFTLEEGIRSYIPEIQMMHGQKSS